MATTKEQWKTAFDLLSKFERGLISPEEFKWQYFIDNVGASKPTLWRNEEFKLEFHRIQKLVKQYKTKNIEYSLERSKQSLKNNIDPEQFNEQSPLIKANKKKVTKNVIDMNDPILAALRGKK